MINPSLTRPPRPLPRPRLELLVHGLQQRMTSSTQKMTVQIEALSAEIRQLESQHAVQLQQSQRDHNRHVEDATTAWDDALHARWDDAELRTFRAVFESAARENQLKIDTRKSCEQVTQEAKKRVSEIEARFLRAKDVPIRRLHEFRANNLNFIGEMMEVDAAADAALAQHSLSVPKYTLSEDSFAKPSTSDDCQRILRAEIADARVHYERLSNHPLARFFESAWIWLISGAVFVAATVGLALVAKIAWLFSLMGGAGITVVLLLITLLVIRPYLKRVVAREFPRVKQLVAHAKHLHDLGDQLAVAENEAELKRLAKKRDDRYQQASNWRDSEITALNTRLKEDIERLHQEAEKQKLSASQQLTIQARDTGTSFTEKLKQQKLAAAHREAELNRALATASDALHAEIDRLGRGGALRMQVATEKALQTLLRSQSWCQQHFPDWSTTDWSATSWPQPLDEPILPLGTLSVDAMPDRSGAHLSSDIEAPVLFAPLKDNYLTITGDPAQPLVQQTVRNLILRALTTLPPGRTQVCVIDPPGLGRDYGWLMHLGDYDPQLVWHRVWTQPGHIAKQIVQLAQSAEDFIQQSLRNQYKDIVEYNRDAGALAEPYRLLVWSSLPAGLDDQSWKAMQSLLDTGTRCGIIPILLIDPSAAWNNPEHHEVIRRRGLHFSVTADGKSLASSSRVLTDLKIRPCLMLDEAQAQNVVHEVGRRAQLASRVEVPLANIVPARDERWQADSSSKLEIPIGQSGVGRVHSLRLGIGTAQHAIIAGKTGSGKSSLLHAIITSALIKYSPENLRLVLLDFKKGVEFQVFANHQVPHADIVGIESHREFGLSALEYVDGCMQRRGELFRSQGVQDIASWNALMPEQHLPRMLLIVDEFQELFVEDDALSSQASLILDRIVRQGRSFGIHAVLSSQTLAGAYSLPRTTLGQMAVRIALQCDASDAQIIFADDNPAAARLKHPGQAVYNDAGGRIEGNQPMQIGWLNKQQQQLWLQELGSGYQNQDRTTNVLGHAVVYDGNRKASWNRENVDRALEQSIRNVNPEACWCVVGESVAISPAVVFPLTNQAGRNVLIAGNHDESAASLLQTITASFVRHHSQQKLELYVIQGAKPTDAKALELPGLWKRLPCKLHVADSRTADELLRELHQRLKQRIEHPDAPESLVPLMLNVIQVGRIRSLRREDEFGMGSFGDGPATSDKLLEEILRDGPSHHIHVVLWAENYSTINRWLSRAALREFEVRAVMQMSANDSTNLIDSVAASRLGENVMLIQDEAVGQSQGFRPFGFTSVSDLDDWVAHRV